MKKRNFKKPLTLILVTIVCLCVFSFNVLGTEPKIINTEIISPYNIAITEMAQNLTISSSTLTCYGNTKVSSGYKATTVVTLQKNVNGSWTDITSWTKNGYLTASVSQTYTATKGISYRLEIIHKAYTSNGSLVESFTKHTSTVTY